MSISNVNMRNNELVFEISNIDLSFVNALRRIILSEIPSIAFRTEPYDKSMVKIINNTSNLHNEFIVHRIGMIPIHIKDVETFDIINYKFVLNVKNTTHTTIDVTTKDINVLKLNNGEFIPVGKDIRDSFFPPDPLTKDHILIMRLKPDNTGKNEGEHLHFEATASKSNGNENARWSVVSQASFQYKIDPKKAEVALQEYLQKHQNKKGSNLSDNEIETLKNRFRLTFADRYYHTNERLEPDEFIMTIESIGVMNPKDIFKQSIHILSDKLKQFINKIENEHPSIEIVKSDSLQEAYDVNIKDEDHTLGYLLQSYITNLYDDINYVGYVQPHPLENKIVLRLSLDTIDNVKKNIIDCCNKIIIMADTFSKEVSNNM